MQNRTTAMIFTIASVLLCGLPGLCACLFGALTATGNMPYNTEFNGITTNGVTPAWVGYALICLALILVAIPFVVGFLTLRRKPAPLPPPYPPSQPIPPAI